MDHHRAVEHAGCRARSGAPTTSTGSRSARGRDHRRRSPPAPRRAACPAGAGRRWRSRSGTARGRPRPRRRRRGTPAPAPAPSRRWRPGRPAPPASCRPRRGRTRARRPSRSPRLQSRDPQPPRPARRSRRSPPPPLVEEVALRRHETTLSPQLQAPPRCRHHSQSRHSGMAWVYILECSRRFLLRRKHHALERRLWQHQNGRRCAVHHDDRRPVRLVWCLAVRPDRRSLRRSRSRFRRWGRSQASGFDRGSDGRPRRAWRAGATAALSRRRRALVTGRSRDGRRATLLDQRDAAAG